jgi:hypothetical protein
MSIFDMRGINPLTVSPTQGVSGMLTSQQAGVNPAVQLATRSIGGLLGMDMRTPNEKLTQGLSQIDPNDPQKMAKMYGLMVQFGTPEQKIAATQKLQELAQNQQNLDRVQRYRDSLIANANQAGLGELTPQIVNANETQLKELAKTIGERQVKLASRGDDDLATVSYMQARGVPKPDLQAQYGKDLADMPSLDEMVKIANAEDQGDIKAFRDAEGNIRTYATLGQKIRVPEKQPDGTVQYKYVNATEAGLSPAPNVIQNMTDETKIGDFLIEGEAKRFLEGYDRAQTATETLALASQAQSLLEYANTGIFSGVKTNFQRVAELMGAPDSVTANAAASEAYFSNRGREFAKFVKNFGTGNSITEKDVQIAREITGGEATLSRRALEQILKDSISIAEGLINNHNSKVDRYVQRNVPEASQFVLDTPPDLTFSPEDFGIITEEQKTTADYLREAQGLL